MKNIIKFIALLFIAFSCKTNAQLDTLNYMKQFETNKIEYINKPFSYLLSQITQIQPKSVWFSPNINNKNIIKKSIFKFCDMEYSFNRNVILEITWQNDIPRSEVKYYEDKNHFYFTEEERAFYGNRVVKDIIVYK